MKYVFIVYGLNITGKMQVLGLFESDASAELCRSEANLSGGWRLVALDYVSIKP